MSSEEQPSVVVNLDAAPLGTPADPQRPPTDAPTDPDAGAEPTEARSKSSASATTEVNVGTRTFVTKSVASNTARPVERVVRSRSALPDAVSVTPPRVRRVPVDLVRAARIVKITPAQVSAPVAPVRPSVTVTPAQVTAPVTPVRPSVAVTPAAPAPVAPVRPSVSVTPVVSAPVTPVLPSVTVTPAVSVPVAPVLPSVAVTPAAPAPVAPVRPSVSVTPVVSAPVAPVRPSVTVMPAVSVPVAPVLPSVAVTPAQVTAPVTTEVVAQRRRDSRFRADSDAAARVSVQVAESVVAGREPVPYFAQDATDGMAVPGRGGLGFVLTVPFALPAELSVEARAALGDAIFVELSRRRLIRRPGESEAGDFWSFESDGSGRLLIISPLLWDTPLTWTALRGVLELVVRHRGTLSRPVSLRIRPSRAEELVIGQRTALIRIVDQNRDVLRRLGVRLADPDGLVFDLLDGSLDPGAAQARIKLALALTTVGRDTAVGRETAVPESEVPVGIVDIVHRVRVPDGRLVAGAFTVYELDQGSGTDIVTDLLIELFPRDADVEQLLALASLSPWPSAGASLTDEGASRAAQLLASGLAQGFTDGCSFLPGSVPRALCERHPDVRQASEQLSGELFRVLIGVTAEGAAAVFDGVAVTESQFATLLRSTGWQREAVLFGFVRLDPAAAAPNPRATRRRPLPPPSPEDWPALLEWTARVAAVLGTSVYTIVPADMNLLPVPDEVLTAYRAYGPAEATRLTANWRTETQVSNIILHCLPTDALPTDADARPGPTLVRLPEEPDESLVALVSTLREAVASLEQASAAAAASATAVAVDGPAPAPAPVIEEPVPVAESDESEPGHPGFLERSELFDAVADAVAERLAHGDEPLSFEIGRAATGASSFSFELEFVLEAEDYDVELAEAATELTALRPGPWSIEPSATADAAVDAAVDGAADGTMKLTSPALGDDVVSWYNLERALETVRRHGGTSVPGTTARLRIEPTGFAGDVGRYQALMALVSTHRDALHRLAGDPTGFVPTPAWRNPALGEPGVITVPPGSGTLDAAVVQTRTRIWLGLVDAARRLVGLSESAGIALLAAVPQGTPDAAQPVRYPRGRPLITGRFAVYEPGSAADTFPARSLIDIALTGRADRERAAALYHVTPRPGALSSRAQVRRGEGWASFGHPAHAGPARLRLRLQQDAELLGPEIFRADLDLGSRRPVPVVYDDAGPAAVQPVHFAALLREAGRPAEAPVALRIALGPWRDWSEATGWIRELARLLRAPVLAGVEGERLARLPDAALDGFTLYALAEQARPGFDWAVAPPAEVWLGIGAAPAAPLAPLPDRRHRGFVRDASWHGVGSCVLFAAPAELGRQIRQVEGIEQHSLLITAVFARSRGGVPQVAVDGAERDLEPAELAAVLFRHAGAAPGAELRLVVLDAIAPDDGVWRVWAGAAAAAAGRIVHYPAPRTSVRLDEHRRRGRVGGKLIDYRLAGPSGGDAGAPRWVAAPPGAAPAHSAFTDDEGWLRPAGRPSSDVARQEERWPARRS